MFLKTQIDYFHAWIYRSLSKNVNPRFNFHGVSEDYKKHN